MSQLSSVVVIALYLATPVHSQFTSTRRRSRIRGGGIAGIIVAAVVLLIIGAILLFVIRRRGRSRATGGAGVLSAPMSQGSGLCPAPGGNMNSNIRHEAGFQPPMGGVPPHSGPGVDYQGPTQPPATYQNGDKQEGYAPPPGIPPTKEGYQPSAANHNVTGHGHEEEPFVGGFRKPN